LFDLPLFLEKSGAKNCGYEKSPENAGSFIEGIELSADWRTQTAIPSRSASGGSDMNAPSFS
jgi:hypothetical protein